MLHWIIRDIAKDVVIYTVNIATSLFEGPAEQFLDGFNGYFDRKEKEKNNKGGKNND